jgi:hypothetical protein
MNTYQQKVDAIQAVLGNIKTRVEALGTYNMVSTDYADLGKAGAYPNAVIKILEILPDNVRELGDWMVNIVIVLQSQTTDELNNLELAKGVLNILENYRLTTDTQGGEIISIDSVLENTGTSRTALIEIEYQFSV